MAKRGRHTKKRVAKRRTVKRGVKSSDKKFRKALCVLKSMKHSDRCKAISSANNAFIRKFSTAIRKSRNKKVSPKLAKRLAHFKGPLRSLANPKVSVSTKKNLLIQKGGLSPALALLAPLVAPLLEPVVRTVGSIFAPRR